MSTLLHGMTSLCLGVPWDRLLVFAAAGTLFLSACHDSPRENPLDPQLTPPVELTVALDDTAGTATLTWTPYSGDQPFAEYRVLRNVSRSTVVDTLAWITVQSECAYRDTSLAPDTAYEYKVATVNSAGYAVASFSVSVAGFSVRAVDLLPTKSDPLDGVIRLQWRQYRDAGFTAYQVYRHQVGTDMDSLLSTIVSPTDTTWIDQGARHETAYSYWVEVQAADRLLASDREEGQIALPAITGLTVSCDSRTATAALQWDRYRGPRLHACQVWRRTGEIGEQTSRLIFSTTDSTITACVDSHLAGGTEYGYQVLVQTDQGESVIGDEVSTAFHQQVAEWPLNTQAPKPGQVNARLYAESNGRITALVASPISAVVKTWDTEGQPLERYTAVYFDPAFIPMGQSWAMTIEPGGDRLLSIPLLASKSVQVMRFGPDRRIRLHEREHFLGIAPAAGSVEQTVLGEVAIRNPSSFMNNVTFDNLRITADGRLLLAEDFEDIPTQVALVGTWEGWDLSGEVTGGKSAVRLGSGAQLHRVIDETQEIDLEVDAMPAVTNLAQGRRFAGSLSIGGDHYSRYDLWLDHDHDQLVLEWTFTPPVGSALPPQHMEYTSSAGLVGLGVLTQYMGKSPSVWEGWLRLGLRLAGGRVTARLATPIWWQQAADQAFYWSSLASLGDIVAVTTDDQLFSVDQDGEGTAWPAAESWVSETRVWQMAEQRHSRVGICLPAANKVLWGTVPAGREERWPEFLRQTLGPSLGQRQVGLSYPLSFAAGPDGRLFVLDAGNARIVAFTPEGQYLTEWGRPGTGSGEFTFGDGQRITLGQNYAGSICVDGEGYIYVADIANQRILKFEP